MRSGLFYFLTGWGGNKEDEKEFTREDIVFGAFSSQGVRINKENEKCNTREGK